MDRAENKAPGADQATRSGAVGWYKDAILYEAHVRSFFDSDADGLGDFRGLTQKLDYLQDLGVTAIWLLPFSPSPLRDDGYDVADYTSVHPSYGTLRDFQNFLKAAHARGLRVLTEVVLNHTSDQHPWFQRSRRAAPGSRWREMYVWSDNPEKYSQARIIFQDFETSNWTWDPIGKAYYWHRFYSHQPDLNYDSPAVKAAAFEVIDFWLDLGVDGLRLDAVPYLYERENTNCENLPETHAFLRDLRQHIDSHYRDRMLLAEANQWPEDAIAYFGDGDECHMAFHFPLMPRLFMATRMEERFPIVDILNQTPPIPQSCQWALFLRNHDELTLEMVTDEERDYMYRVYAHDGQSRINLGIRRRLAPLLGNDRRRIELMNGLLFSLPGTPVIYYGDEIGMGDNIYLGDRNSVRTPMQWSADRNAGFSRSNPQRLYLPIIIDAEYHYEAVNVEAQQNNPNSLLWWMRHLVEERKRFKALGRGTLEFLHPENRRIVAFVRSWETETILVVANLSRFPQQVGLNLAAFQGMKPVEVFGRTHFPEIDATPYVITLGAHGFYWFSLERNQALSQAVGGAPGVEPVLLLVDTFEGAFEGSALRGILEMLPRFLQTRPWFLAPQHTILSVVSLDVIRIPDTLAWFLLVEVQFADADPQIYALNGAVLTEGDARGLLERHPEITVARVRASDGSEGVITGGVWSEPFCTAMLNAIVRRRRIRGKAGEIFGTHNRALRKVWAERHPDLAPSVTNAEQRNSSVEYGSRFYLKLLRRLDIGLHPEVEANEMLARNGFTAIAPITGALEYHVANGGVATLGLLYGYVANEGDGWHYTLDAMSRFFSAAMARPDFQQPPIAPSQSPVFLLKEPAPALIHEMLGAYPEAMRLLGQRTAQMHLALVSDSDPGFSYEPFTDHYRLGLYHALIGLAGRCFEQLRGRLPELSSGVRTLAEEVLSREEALRTHLRPLRDRRFDGMRTRVHGDYTLREVLYTGNDFVIIDFEGDPARPLTERRLKRSGLCDVATLLRSLQDACNSVMSGAVPGVTPRPEVLQSLSSWAGFVYRWVGTFFLRGYCDAMAALSLVPSSPENVDLLLNAYGLDKCLREILIELERDPDATYLPLLGLRDLLDRSPLR